MILSIIASQILLLGSQDLSMELRIYNQIDIASDKLLSLLSECEKETLNKASSDIIHNWLDCVIGGEFPVRSYNFPIDYFITDEMMQYLIKKT